VDAFVGFNRRLYGGQSTTFDLRFDLVDSGGSTDRDLRIGHNLMSFPVMAFGSPGTPGSTVTVVFPPDFTVQEEFGGLTRSVYGSGEVVFSSGPIDDPSQLSAWFTAVQPVPPSAYLVRSVTIGPLSVALRYWSDDVGWADQVERVLRAGYPLLREMIGLGDPLATTLTVEEDSTQEIGGFSGSYDTSSHQVLVSYFADPFVILHETAHMWFNGDLLSDRWADEGFASYYAQQAVDRLGLTDHAPGLTARMRQAAVPLNDWVTAGDPSSAVDEYLYGATLEVAREIAADAGPAALSEVWAAARSGKAAYQPLHSPGNEMLYGGAADWRRLLDLLDQTTGRSLAGIWRTWIIDAAQQPLLDQRSTALAAYTESEKAAGTWDLPPEIRRSLDMWQYQSAMLFMAQARNIVNERDQISAQAKIEGTTPPGTLRNDFEHQGLVAASAEATSELDVLNELAAARQAKTDKGDAAQAVGLLGADPNADLIAARDAFARGDMTRAMSLAAGARLAWQGASGAGQARIFGAICVLLGLALLAGLLSWLWRDNRRRKERLAASIAAGEVPAAGGDGAPWWGGAGLRLPAGIDSLIARRPSWASSRARSVAVMTATRLSPRAGAAKAGVAARAGRLASWLPRPTRKPGGVPEAAPGPDEGSIQNAAVADPVESAYDLMQRGNELLKGHHNAQAAVVLERAARLEPRKGSILEALGRAYFNSGQHARAAETFEALLDVDPSADYGHFALGLCFGRLGRPKEALTHLRLAVALDPSSGTYERALKKAETARGQLRDRGTPSDN
jgi:tetratricopeptide (TPR) repeat protein